MTAFKKVIHFFDRLEDGIRANLSRWPIAYALIGGVGIVMFWKGVWEAAEFYPDLYGLPSAIFGLLLLLPTGLFVSFFIGDNIIISGFKREKKLVDRTEHELRADIDSIKAMAMRIEHIERAVESLHRHLHTPHVPEREPKEVVQPHHS
ncbi:MAG: hypothetical protein AAB964_01855 [Patescibacteria group bacterium]